MIDYRVILIHGYNKSKNDMYPLGNFLKEKGYKIDYLSLPLLFKGLDYSVTHLKEFLYQLHQSGVDKREEIILIGHSLGGLVIRGVLSDEKIREIVDKVVLIAPPNNGCKLADYAKKYLPFMRKIFKPLQAIESHNISKQNLYTGSNIDIAVIAGSEPNLFLGKLLDGKNDGRLQVEEVVMDNLKDFIVLPLGHKEIHKRVGTAKYIDNFIKRSSFLVD